MNEFPETNEVRTGSKLRFHRFVCGPLASISIGICTLLIMALFGFFNSELERLVVAENVDNVDMVFLLFVCVSTAVELVLNIILRRLGPFDDALALSQSKSLARSIYRIELVSGLLALLYYALEWKVMGKLSLPWIIAAAVPICVSAVVLIGYKAGKKRFDAALQSAFEQSGSKVVYREKETSLMGGLKTLVFIVVVMSLVLEGLDEYAISKDASQYPAYSEDDLQRWIDKTWQGYEAHSERIYSLRASDEYNETTIIRDIDDYLDRQNTENLRFYYGVTAYKPQYTVESGHIVLELDFTYKDDHYPKYNQLPSFKTKEDGARILGQKLRAGENELWFLVSGDWFLDDVDDLADLLSDNDVQTAAEWTAFSRLITNFETNGMKLAYIRKIYDMDEDYLKVCSEELAAKVTEIAAEIESKGYTEKKDMYKAVADKVMKLTQYDDDTRISSLTKNLSNEDRVNRSAYGALITGKTVCTGYAYAYKAICDELGLFCQVISGHNGDGGHAWNYIGDGLYVDCTFCDTSYSSRYMFMDQKRMDAYHYYVSATQIFLDQAA